MQWFLPVGLITLGFPIVTLRLPNCADSLEATEPLRPLGVVEPLVTFGFDGRASA